MQKLTRLLSIFLLLAMVLSLLPVLPVLGAEAEEAEVVAEATLPVERPATKAVSVSSISVPAYSGGTASSWMTYDCGQYLGLANTGTQSKMQIIKGTTGTQLLNYRDKLTGLGYTLLYQKAVDAQSGTNRHIKCLSPDGTFTIYAYYVEVYQETRIIVDTNADTLRRISYTDSGNNTGLTEVYMVPFSASQDGYGYSSAYGSQNRNNAGAMYVIKFADNSLFVVDGGSYIQMSDRDCERVYALLRRITGIPEGQKIVINTWFVSHYHDDHVSGFPRFLSKYYTHFDLQNVMYNFDVVGASGDNTEIIGKLYPNAKYYKQHTGEYFTICDVRFDVLYTVEDLYTPNSSNKLTLRDVGCMRKSDEENNCSSVLRVTFDGKTMLLTGDIYDADRILIAMYPQADLHADILQIPHHAFDGHVTLVKTVAPSISFLNQVERATTNRKDLYTNNHNWMPYAGTIYYGNSNLIGYCAEKGIFLQEPFTEGVDWLGWGNLTRDMDEANYYESSTVTASEQYYRYDRVTTAPTKINGTFILVDNKMGYPLSYSTANGAVTNGSAAFYSNDRYYFGASQRRLVNWNITTGTASDLSLAIASGGKGYYVSGSVTKGSGDYWGTNTKNANMALGRGDSYTASGMFSSWASFTNQMETTTNSVRLDMLQDNTFLLYARYDNSGSSTYHPLYRDAYMAKTDQGWGASNLTKTAANEKLDYLKLRLYSYNTTPDTLLLSWTGHKDYYANPGISKSQALSLLTADLRVNYRFKTSSDSGEIYYDGWQKNAPGTFWLEFPSNFSGSTPGDYTITIKFANHNGSAQSLGTFTLHIRNRSNDPATKSLFFDFNDSTTSRKNYQYEPQYNGINFDATSRWDFIEYNASTKTNDIAPGFVDNLSGTLKLYTKAADTTRKNLSIRTFAGSYNPLNYSPKNAEVVQIRFKAENLKASVGETANFRLCYYKDGGTDTIYETIYTLGSDYVADGEYRVITVPLTQTFRDCTTITGLRPAFSYVIPTDTTKPGCITIDYIYVGPKDNAPPISYTATFVLPDGKVLHSQTVSTDGSVVYTGTTPTMAPDAENHYSFAGWDKPLTGITADTTFTARFTATPHIYTYSKVDENNHKGICSCGHTLTDPHTWNSGEITSQPGCDSDGIVTYTCSVCSTIKTDTVASTGHNYTSVTTAPTCADQGYTTYTCSHCGHSYTDNYTEATDHTVVIDEAVAATCTAPGLTEGMHCIVCSAVIVSQETVPAKGHNYVYTGINALSHLITCENCDFSEEASHGYEDGSCICGEPELKEPIENPNLKLSHTLNLASNISINFAIAKTALEGFDMDTIYVESVLDIYEGNEKTGTETLKLEPVDMGYFYYFTLTGITAVQMNDRIQSSLYGVKDGQPYVSTVDNYSVGDYAYSQLNKTTVEESLKVLCADLLRYGTKAQIFKSYRTDAPVDGSMTEEHKSYLSEIEAVTFGNTNKVLTDLDNAPITWTGKALNLESKVMLRFVFSTGSYTGDISKLTARVSYNDIEGNTKTVVLEKPEEYMTGMGLYTFTTDSLLAAELRAVVSVQIFEGETPVSCTLQYSADTYANGKTGTLLELCKALFAYSDSAKIYFAR